MNYWKLYGVLMCVLTALAMMYLIALAVGAVV